MTLDEIPYATGAGAPRPELAGRNALIERAAIALIESAQGGMTRA